jgi:hypothetical protein
VATTSRRATSQIATSADTSTGVKPSPVMASSGIGTRVLLAVLMPAWSETASRTLRVPLYTYVRRNVKPTMLTTLRAMPGSSETRQAKL